MKRKQFVTAREVIEMYKEGFCLRCVNKFFDRDGDLPLTEMCDECREKMLSSILVKEEDE